MSRHHVRTPRPATKKRLVWLGLMVVVAIAASGCALLGLQGQNTFDKDAQVRETVQSLAAAGQLKEAQSIQEHLAQSVRLLNLKTATSGLRPLSQESTISALSDLWAGVTVHRSEVTVRNVEISGDTADITGSYFVDFTDQKGQRSECTVAGEAVLVNNSGKWVVTQVSSDTKDCTVTEPAPQPDPTPEPTPNPDPQPSPDPTPDPQTNPGQHQYYFNVCRYLVLGQSGEQVRAVQTSLNSLGIDAGLVDGKFGPITADALRTFQGQHGLSPDGQFGPTTQAALDQALDAEGGFYGCGVSQQSPDAGPTTVTEKYLREGTPYESKVLIYESPNPGPTLWFQGCIHGNEQSGHLALEEAVNRGITISRGRLVVVPAFNQMACDQDRRTLSDSGSLLDGKDFNRMFDVGSSPSYLIAQETWDLLTSQPDLAFVVDFHDGFVNSLGNTLIHSRQSHAASVADTTRDTLNQIRPSDAVGPAFRSFTEPIGGSLTRKVGRDLGIPAMEVELCGRSVHDPLSLRMEYAWRVIHMVGYQHDMAIAF